MLFTTLYRNRRFVVYFSKRLCYSAFGHPTGPLALLSTGGWDVLVLRTEFVFLNLVVDVCYSVSKTLCNSTWTCSTLFSSLFFMEDACMLRMSRCRTTTPPHPTPTQYLEELQVGAERRGKALPQRLVRIRGQVQDVRSKASDPLLKICSNFQENLLAEPLLAGLRPGTGAGRALQGGCVGLC